MDIVVSNCGSVLSGTCAYLLDASGSLVGFNNGQFGERPCAINTQAYFRLSGLPAGTYFVVSEGYSSNGSITTTIKGSLSRTVVDFGTKNTNFMVTDTQNTVYSADTYQGRPTNDIFYRFTITYPMIVTISHCGSSLSDTYLSLLDSSGNCIAYNDDYSICYIGGLDKSGQPSDTRTPEQKESLRALVADVCNRYPITSIAGHWDYSPDSNKKRNHRTTRIDKNLPLL